MKLTGKLKEQVGKAATKEEAMEIIKDAGMILNDEELDQASGGFDNIIEDDTPITRESLS